MGRRAGRRVHGGGRSRLRFHLERDGETGTALRFTHEFQGETESERRWRARFEALLEVLAGGGS